MKKSLLILLIFLSSAMTLSLLAQEISEKVKSEINQTLQSFNTAAQNANTEQLMALFDNSANIMFIGGDSAEIWKGQNQIRGHLNSIFPHESVSLKWIELTLIATKTPPGYLWMDTLIYRRTKVKNLRLHNVLRRFW
jgi:hypothetical protein